MADPRPGRAAPVRRGPDPVAPADASSSFSQDALGQALLPALAASVAAPLVLEAPAASGLPRIEVTGVLTCTDASNHTSSPPPCGAEDLRLRLHRLVRRGLRRDLGGWTLTGALQAFRRTEVRAAYAAAVGPGTRDALLWSRPELIDVDGAAFPQVLLTPAGLSTTP